MKTNFVNTLINAAKTGDIATLKLCINLSTNESSEKLNRLYSLALEYATKNENIAAVKLLSQLNINCNNALIIATLKQNLELVNHFLNLPGININARDKKNRTALMYAAGKKLNRSSELLIDLLLERGADVNLFDNEGNHALMHALQHPDITPSRQYITEKLIQAHSLLNVKDKQGISAIRKAVWNDQSNPLWSLLQLGGAPIEPEMELEIAALLANESVFIDLINLNMPQGLALHIAVRQISRMPTHSNQSFLKNILPLINVNAPDLEGRTPLMIAITEYYYSQNSNLITLLLKAGANVNSVDKAGLSVLHYALKTKSLSLVIGLIEAKADIDYFAPSTNDTPLILAVKEKNPSLVITLLQAGANPNFKNKEGKTAFAILQDLIATNKISANTAGIMQLVLAPQLNMPDVFAEIQSKIKQHEKIKANVANFIASRHFKTAEQKNIFQELIQLGLHSCAWSLALTKKYSPKSSSALSEAIQHDQENMGVNTLKQKSIPSIFEVENYQAKTNTLRQLSRADKFAGLESNLLFFSDVGSRSAAIVFAARNNDIHKLKILLNTADNHTKKQALDWAIYKNNQIIIDSLVTELGMNAGLFAAVKQLHTLPLVQQFISQGADVNSVDEHGNSVLMAACYCGVKNLGTIQLLLNKKANIHHQNYQGDTALTVSDSMEVIKILLQQGANINHQNANGDTLLLRFLFHPHPSQEIFFLLNAGADITLKNSQQESVTTVVCNKKNTFTKQNHFLLTQWSKQFLLSDSLDSLQKSIEQAEQWILQNQSLSSHDRKNFFDHLVKINLTYCKKTLSDLAELAKTFGNNQFAKVFQTRAMEVNALLTSVGKQGLFSAKERDEPIKQRFRYLSPI